MREKIPIGEKVFVYKDSPYLPLVIVNNKEINAWDIMDTLSDKEKTLVAKAKELREALEKKDITVITQIQKEYDTLLENMRQETTIEKWQSKVNQEIAPTEKVDEFSIFEKLDEEQIVEELEGKVITEYFYSFLVGGREVTGISWAGIKAVARYMSMQNAQHGLGGIEVLPIDLEKDIKETDQYIIATARAIDHGTGLSMVGISKQAKYVTRKDGTQVPDEFALVKACSKAMRNAIRALIPESIIIEMYNRWKEGENKR